MSIIDALGYGFIQRAIIAGSFVAVLCSVLGVILVLRRLSLIGDGLAHVTFGGVALSLLMKGHPLLLALPVVMLSSLGILKLMERARIYGDAAIGMLSALGIAVGVIVASTAGGFNVDLFSFLFGNILSVTGGEVAISIMLALLLLAILVLNYHELRSIAFDEEFARASGINTERLNRIIALCTAVTVVLTMKVVGIMLTSALLILPAVTAFQVAHGFRNTLFIAAAAALSSVISGIFISIVFDLPAGAAIVVMNFLFFAAGYFRRALKERGGAEA